MCRLRPNRCWPDRAEIDFGCVRESISANDIDRRFLWSDQRRRRPPIPLGDRRLSVPGMAGEEFGIEQQRRAMEGDFPENGTRNLGPGTSPIFGQKRL